MLDLNQGVAAPDSGLGALHFLLLSSSIYSNG